MAALVIPAAIVPSARLLVKTSLMIALQRRSMVVEVDIILRNVLNGIRFILRSGRISLRYRLLDETLASINSD